MNCFLPLLGGTTASNRAWSPTDIGPSLKMWLDPNVTASVTLNGSTVSALADLSGTGNNAVQGTAGNQPTYSATGLSGKPGVLYTSGKTMTSTLGISVIPRTYFFLFNNTNPGSGTRVLIAGNGASGIELRLNASNGWTMLQQGVTSVISSASPLPAGLVIFMFAFDGTGLITRVNGAYTDVVAVASLSLTARTAVIGSAGGAEYFDSYMGPILAIDAMLTENQIEKIEGYIANEYAIQSLLPTNHTYKSTAPTIVPVDTSWKFATNRTRSPSNFLTSTNGSQYNAANQVYWMPDYDQYDLMVCIPNFYTPQISFAPFEVDCGAGRVVEGVFAKIGGVTYPMISTGRTALVPLASSAGQTSHTFVNGEAYVWFRLSSAVLPALSSVNIFQATFTPIGQKYPAGFNPIVSKYGDGGNQAGTSQLSACAAGTVQVPAFGLLSPNPIAIVSKGCPVGRPVVFSVGDSIGDSANANAANAVGARANRGYLDIGLDNNTSNFGIFADGHFCVGATSFSSITPVSGVFAFRHQLLKDVGFPFTTILCQHLNNNVGAGLAGMKGLAGAAWVWMKTFSLTTVRPKLIQVFANPLAADSSNDQWTTTTNQVASSQNAYPAGERWGFVSFIKTLPPDCDDYVDVTPYWVANNDQWASLGRNSVLTNTVSSGLVITVTGTPPTIGDDILIGAGAAGWIVRNVGAVAANGGDWNVTFTLGEAAISSTFTAGTAVRAQPTKDSIHPSGAQHIAASAAIIAVKTAGKFV